MLYSVACFENECFENGWVANHIKTYNDKGIAFDASYHPYIEAIHYTLSIMLCVKMSSVIEYVLHEKIIRHVLVFVAYCAFSLFFAEICAAMVLALEETQRYREHIASMRVFMKRCKIAQHLQKQVAAVIEFKWAYNKNVSLSGKKKGI